MTDHTHAIALLRLMITDYFRYRHGARDIDVWQYALIERTPPVVSKHWWDHESRRLDIARLRSYIGAVRVLEQGDTKVTGCRDCPARVFVPGDRDTTDVVVCGIDGEESRRVDCWQPHGETSDPPGWCPLRSGLVTIRLEAK